MISLRSPGWRVDPAFVEGTPTEPVTLLADDAGLTQLAGEGPNVWQIPWAQLTDPQVVRYRRRYELVARVGGRQFRWRRSDNQDREAWIDIWAGRGADVRSPRRVLAPLLVMILILVGVGSSAWLARPSVVHYSRAARSALGALLGPQDLGTSWSTTNTSQLINLVGPAGQVGSPAGAPALTGAAAVAEAAGARAFQSCLHVTNRVDRIYGAAGQFPVAQGASPVYTNTIDGGIQIASVTQYYASAAMVAADTREMSTKGFGHCFAESQAVLLRTVITGPSGSIPAQENDPAGVPGVFVRGGVAPADLSSVGVGKLSLVVDVITYHHLEISVVALVASPSGVTVVDRAVELEIARLIVPSALSV